MVKSTNGKNGKTNSKTEPIQGFGTVYIPKENIVNLKEIFDQDEKAKRKKPSLFKKIKKERTEKTVSKPSAKFQQPQPLVIQEVKSDRPKANLSGIRLPLGWGRALLTFSLICTILLAPIYGFFFFGQVTDVKGKVLGVSFEAYDYLQSAQSSAQDLNISQAKDDFDKATDSFKSAQAELSQVNSVLLNIGQFVPFKGAEVKTGASLLKAGQALSEAGSYITTAIEPLLQKDLTVLIEETTTKTNLVETLIYSFDYLRPALLKIKIANQYLLEVDVNTIPADYQEQIGSVKTSLPVIEKSFEQTIDILDVLLYILGREQTMRYLVVFQNNHEIRPTGGFIGSFALIDIDKGEIKAVEVPGGGPYEINTYLKERVIAPEPLHLVNPHWYLQDANWFPDFPTSAEKMIWFYENSGGPSVDGVLTFTPTVLENLLEITGPIEMEEYGVTVDHKNFVPITQNIVEVEFDKETNTPKKFIADLLPKLLDKVFAGESLSENAFDILKVFYQSLAQKHILFYFPDQTMQEKVVELGWAGEIKQAPSDYLMVVNTNVGGGKTDGAIDEIIEHNCHIQPDGSIINTVTVKRIHHGQEGDPFTGIRNVDYIRFYVPQGSQLLEIEGQEVIDSWRWQMPDPDFRKDDDLTRIEQDTYIDDASKTRISNQFGKTVFGNWLAVSPGQSAKLTIRYKLPFKIDQETDRYSLYVQKQSGSFGSYLISEVSFPSSYGAIWAYPDNTLSIGQDKAIFEHDLAQDQFFGLVLKK